MIMWRAVNKAGRDLAGSLHVAPWITPPVVLPHSGSPFSEPAQRRGERGTRWSCSGAYPSISRCTMAGQPCQKEMAALSLGTWVRDSPRWKLGDGHRRPRQNHAAIRASQQEPPQAWPSQLARWLCLLCFFLRRSQAKSDDPRFFQPDATPRGYGGGKFELPRSSCLRAAGCCRRSMFKNRSPNWLGPHPAGSSSMQRLGWPSANHVGARNPLTRSLVL